MTTRDEILKVGQEYGWVQHGPSVEGTLDLHRAPANGQRYTLWVEFDWDTGRVEYAEANGVRITGGREVLKKHLRWNGRKQ